jgi:oligoendopeptidase F
MPSPNFPLLALAAVLATPASAETPAVDTETWNLSDLYPDLATWEAAKGAIDADIVTLAEYAGRLGDKNGAVLQEFLDRRYTIRRELARLYSYASNGASGDTRDAVANSRRMLGASLYTKLGETTSFVEPELLEMGPKAVHALLKKRPGLATYAHPLEEVLRRAPYTLDAKGETLLAAAGELRQGPFSAYRVLANADMPWPTLTLENGEEVLLDQAAYGKHRSSRLWLVPRGLPRQQRPPRGRVSNPRGRDEQLAADNAPLPSPARPHVGHRGPGVPRHLPPARGVR